MKHVAIPGHDLYLDETHAILKWQSMDSTPLRAAFRREDGTLVLARVETRTRPPQPLDVGAEAVPDEILGGLRRRGFEIVDGTADDHAGGEEAGAGGEGGAPDETAEAAVEEVS
jgi:hypothetical protein